MKSDMPKAETLKPENEFISGFAAKGRKERKNWSSANFTN